MNALFNVGACECRPVLSVTFIPAINTNLVIHITMSLHRAQVALDVPDSNCLKHGNKLVLHFCKTCNESGCSKCMQTKHRNHDWCDIEDIEDQKQKELEKDVNILENNILPKLNEKREQAVKEADLDKSEIDRQADAMKTVIDKYRELLKSKVDSTRSSDTGSAAMIADLDRDIADIQQIIRNSKKSIAIQAKSEIVQGSENVKVVIAEVDKSLAEMGRRTVGNFRSGEIDTQVLQRMFGDMESEDDLSSDFDDMKLSSPLRDVTVEVKNIIAFGSKAMRICPLSNQTWVNESASGKIVRMNIHGKPKSNIILVSSDFQGVSRSNSGDIYMCFSHTGWISRLTTDRRVKDIVNIKPLHPISLCVTQSGDILVALVDVLIKDFDKCEHTYIARLDNLGREKQRIQFEKDGQTPLYQYTTYVEENRNGDIIVLDKLSELKSRLYISDRRGVPKHSYNGTSKLYKYDFYPVSVCCDDQCRIIVADINNSALHLLNARGELLQLLMTEKDGLVHPYSLGLCDGLLWIGTTEGKVIVAEYKQVHGDDNTPKVYLLKHFFWYQDSNLLITRCNVFRQKMHKVRTN